MQNFYDFCQNLNATSKESMSEILEQEADFKTMQIVYNSMEDPKNDRTKIRETLSPCIGKLYPLYYMILKNVDTFEEMKDTVKGFLEYKAILAEVPEPNRVNENFQKTLEDFMYEEEVKMLCDTFDE